MSVNLAKLWPSVRQRLHLLDIRYRQLHPDGPQLRIVCTYRSPAEQDALYAQGRKTPGPEASPEHPLGRTVTRNRGGTSLHNFDPCPAVDWGLFDARGRYVQNPTERQVLDVVELAEELGFDSGWRWPSRDGFHLQPPGYTLADARQGAEPAFPGLPDWVVPAMG